MHKIQFDLNCKLRQKNVYFISLHTYLLKDFTFSKDLFEKTFFADLQNE